MALVLLGLILGGGILVAVRHQPRIILVPSRTGEAQHQDVSPPAPRQQAGGGGLIRGGVGTSDAATTATPPILPAGLARAYATLGELRDGARRTLPALDAETQRFVEQAKELLDQDTLHTATPRPAGTAPRQAPMPIRGDCDKVLTEPDAWVAIPYDPARATGRPLTLRNGSSGDYGYSINGDDFGSVRVNGGLVVPGRFYRLDGTVTISSEVPVGVHIRPLANLGSYADAPRRPPSGKG